MIAEIKRNEEKNGIEIYFNVYPLAGTKSTMKKNGFRWNPKKACWYAKYSLDAQAIADIIADTTDEEYAEIAKQSGEEVKSISVSAKIALATKNARREQRKSQQKKEEAQNEFGVKVGDVFAMSWGYEQTNNDFFQVVALAGKKSVRIVEVYPELVKEEAISGMSADRYYNVRKCRKVESSMWIDDQENGDLKRLKSWNADGSNPQISMTSYANAYLVKEDTIKVYASWYY